MVSYRNVFKIPSVLFNHCIGSNDLFNFNGQLKPEWKIFSEQYVIDWNGTRAYQVAYPNVDYETAKANASRLLTNANVQAYIEEIQKDLAKLAGVSALKILMEHKKMAFSSLASFKDDWMTLKDFDGLSDDLKASLSEIQHTTKTIGKTVEEIVKFKLHDKQKSLDSITKMLGYDAPVKSEVLIKTLTPEERKARIAEIEAKAIKTKK